MRRAILTCLIKLVELTNEILRRPGISLAHLLPRNRSFPHLSALSIHQRVMTSQNALTSRLLFQVSLMDFLNLTIVLSHRNEQLILHLVEVAHQGLIEVALIHVFFLCRLFGFLHARTFFLCFFYGQIMRVFHLVRGDDHSSDKARRRINMCHFLIDLRSDVHTRGVVDVRLRFPV